MLEPEILFLFCGLDPVPHTFICYPTFLPNSSLGEVLLRVRTQVQNCIVQVINSGDSGDGLGDGEWERDVCQTQDPVPRRGLLDDSCLRWNFLPHWRHYLEVSGDQWWWGFPIIPHRSAQLRPRGLSPPFRGLLLIRRVTKLLGCKSGGISQNLSSGSSIIKIWLIVPQYLSFGESLTRLKINHLTQSPTPPTTQNLKMFTAAIWLLFKIAKKWKQLKRPSTDGQTNVHPHNGMPFRRKKQWSADARYKWMRPKNMWKQPDRKGHVACDAITMKRPKQANPQRQNAVKELLSFGRDAMQANCTWVWSLFGGWYKCSGIRQWWLICNSVSILKAAAFYPLKGYTLWYVIMSQ